MDHPSMQRAILNVFNDGIALVSSLIEHTAY